MDAFKTLYNISIYVYIYNGSAFKMSLQPPPRKDTAKNLLGNIHVRQSVLFILHLAMRYSAKILILILMLLECEEDEEVV